MLTNCWQVTCIRTCSPKPPSWAGGVISKDFPGGLRAHSVGDQGNRPALPQRLREQLRQLPKRSTPRCQSLLEVRDVLRRHAPEGRYGRGGGRKAFATRPGEREVIDRMKVLREGGLAVDKIAAALNPEHANPRAGQQWYPTSVYRIPNPAA